MPMPRRRETRMFTTDREVRVETRDDGSNVLTGHAAVFNKASVDFGGWTERVLPGAFKKSLAGKPDVRALVNHSPNLLLGRTRSETLKLAEDDDGLAVEIILPDTTAGRDVKVNVDRGDITGMSFAFWTIEDRWHKEEEQNVRELVEVDIDGGDVSPVTYPAYPDTDVSLRAAMGAPTLLNDDKLARAIVRAEHDLEMDDDDLAAIRSASDRLAKLLPQTPLLAACRARLAELDT